MKISKKVLSLITLIFINVTVFIIPLKGCTLERFFNEKNINFNKNVSNSQLEAIKNIILNQDQNKEFDNVLLGKIYDYDISLPFDWSCDNITSSDLCFKIHGFLFLDNVYKQWEETSDELYRDTIKKYMLDWIKNNPKTLEGNKWAWNDDAVARRVFRMSYYAYIWQKDFTKDEMNIILASLKNQAELLADEKFYTKLHNHGMFQDMGLISYALLWADTDKKSEYLELAKTRSNEYFNYVFTSDGIHKEHSPSYHINVSEKLLFFKDIYKDIDNEFCDSVSKLYLNSSEFLANIVLPNGVLPSIGDSSTSKLKSKKYDNPHYLYAVTNGKEGEMPENEHVFKEGGYAVMRSSWLDSPEDATYLLFLASTHSSAHKHGDDLSFILYHGGDLFVEAGNRDYNYSDEMTAYSYSGYGHNVLLVNDEAFPVKYGPTGSQNIYPAALETKIVDFDIDSNIKSVSGIQKRFDNMEQERKIKYDKENNIVEVLDLINSSVDEKGTLIYHIAEGIEVKDNKNGWYLMRNNRVVAEVSVMSESKDIKLSSIKNEEGNAPYYTWIFEGKTTPKIGSLLKVDFPIKVGRNSITMKIKLLDNKQN